METKTLYRLFLGSDNRTKKLDKSAIIAAALDYFPAGFTYYEARGIWNGGQEKTGIVEVLTDQAAKVEELALKLKTKLNQEAVLIQTYQMAGQFV